MKSPLVHTPAAQLLSDPAAFKVAVACVPPERIVCRQHGQVTDGRSTSRHCPGDDTVQHTAADNLISLAPALLLRDGFSGLGVLASGGVMSLFFGKAGFSALLSNPNHCLGDGLRLVARQPDRSFAAVGEEWQPRSHVHCDDHRASVIELAVNPASTGRHRNWSGRMGRRSMPTS